MSTKLNAEELAAKRYDNGYMHIDDRGRCFDITLRLRECAATAIREVAQPIADERDEMWRALTYMVRIAEDQGWTDDFLSIPRAILAKYNPKP